MEKINRRNVIDIDDHNRAKKTLCGSENTNRNKMQESEEKPGGSETILVVDEDSWARRDAIEELSGLGYTLLEAEDGRDVLEIIKKNPGKIDLLVTNVIMPLANGVQIYRQIKEFDPEMRAIFMLRFTEDFMIYHSISADGKDGVNFLRKPNDPQTLARKVRSVLDS